MPFRSLGKVAASAVLAALASGAQSAVVYSLANDGTSLVRFDSAAPGAVTALGAISGATTRLNGLDFRPANGFLYGFSQATSGIYRVDTGSGTTTLVSTSTAPVTTDLLGIDFNPVPDRLRVVTVNDENRRINVDNGVVPLPLDGTLAYSPGDVNFGRNPNIIDAGYTNSDRNPGTGTTLYYIDHVLDTLVRATGNPNDGMLTTVGSLGFDTNDSRFTGFDIFTDLNGANTAFASLQVGGIDGLYTINLVTGSATPLGVIGATNLFGLAVAPVPEPGSLALVAAAGLAAFGIRRRSAPASGGPTAA